MNYLQTASFLDEVVDSCVRQLETDLPAELRLLGKQDGVRTADLLDEEYVIKVKEPTRLRVEEAINFIRSRLQVSANAHDAEELRKMVQEKSSVLRKENNHDERVLDKLERERNVIRLDPLKQKWGRWVPWGAGIISTGDAILAYQSFRFVYSALMAAVASFGVGVCVFGAHFLSGWVLKPVSMQERIYRVVVLLVISFLLFLLIGSLRSQAIQSHVDITLPGQDFQLPATNHISAFMIATISEILFASILFVALIFHKTKKERDRAAAYNQLSAEITKVRNVINKRCHTIKVMEQRAIEKSSEVRACFEFIKIATRRCKTAGAIGLQEYKKAYLDIHDGPVPSCFKDSDKFASNDDDFFLNVK